jgi:hypothetical protein
MKTRIRFQGGLKPPNNGGFATSKLAIKNKSDEAVNDSLGSVHLADTMDTDPDKDPEAGGKGMGEKVAE